MSLQTITMAFPQPADGNDNEMHLEFHQARQEFLNDHFDMTEADAFEISALLIQKEFPNKLVRIYKHSFL